MELEVSLQKVACSVWSRYLLLGGCRRCTGSQVTHCRTSDQAALSHATRAAGAPAQAFPWTAKVKIQVRWGASAGRIGLRSSKPVAGHPSGARPAPPPAAVPKIPCDRLSIPSPQSKTNFQFKFITTLPFGLQVEGGYVSIIGGRADKV